MPESAHHTILHSIVSESPRTRKRKAQDMVKYLMEFNCSGISCTGCPLNAGQIYYKEHDVGCITTFLQYAINENLFKNHPFKIIREDV